MIELEQTNDRVRLCFLQALLTDAGVETFVFDDLSPWPGVFPGRLMVADQDAARARAIIAGAPPAFG